MAWLVPGAETSTARRCFIVRARFYGRPDDWLSRSKRSSSKVRDAMPCASQAREAREMDIKPSFVC